jgi:glycosyltransferase involved in cell wall biosynthesis
MGKYKIAVYAIALNEEKHVLRWWESAREADLVLLADTGSTDRTLEIANSTGMRVEKIYIHPWRFDTARNSALAMIPADFDICVALDLDEVLQVGWREIVEEGYERGLRWMSFKMITARDNQRQVKSYFIQNKIHTRTNFSWRYLIHEYLVADSSEKIERGILDLEVDHLFDSGKSRQHYLDILIRNLKEYPNEFHAYLLLIREYINRKEWLNIFKHASLAMELATSDSFALSLIYRWGSEAAFNLELHDLARKWAKRACKEAPDSYESWLWLAKVEYHFGNFKSSRDHALKIELLKPLNNGYGNLNAWKWDGFNWIAASQFKLGQFNEAVFFGFRAHQGFPESQQLQNNLMLYSKTLDQKLAATKSRGVKTNLGGFPPIYMITLKSFIERQKRFFDNVAKFGLEFPIVIEGLKASGDSREELFAAISSSHLDAIRKFYVDGLSEWAVICEDDASFDLSELWPFNWNEKFEEISRLDIDILQMCNIVSDVKKFLPMLHKRRENVDWSTGIYLISRKGASAILESTKDKIPNSLSTESFLLDGLDVYTAPLFTADGSLTSLRDQSHIEALHIPSWNMARQYYEGLWGSQQA